jgi:4-alpha-glucanotransferase
MAREPRKIGAVALLGRKAASVDQDLLRQAQSAGIETFFIDVDGQEQHAAEPTLRLLLELLSRPKTDGNLLVVRHGDAIDLLSGNGVPALATLRKREHVLARSKDAQLALPDDLPRGDYRLDLALDDGQRKSFKLLHTPARAYQPRFALEGCRSWILSVQLYSLCSARNFGHGDFTDLRQLLELVADAGGGGVGVNPLHALAEDDADAASPYAPSSRIFLNWLYIDVGLLPGIEPDELDGMQPHESPDDGLIDYAKVAAAKETVLRLAYRRFVERGSEDERAAFAAYRQDMGEDLRRYAAFCLLRRREGGSWRYWRRPWAQPTPQDLETFARENADEIGYHEFVQFHAFRQLAECTALAQRRQMDVGLYLDVAVGVHPDGFDAWNDPDVFLHGASIGAPPDPLNKAGQNWGLTSFHPGMLRQRGYEPFRKMLGASMRHAGAIRIDHVLGLNRLYVVPPGSEATQGAYIKYPLAELLAVLAMESQFHRCLVIGEDLGTVPDGLRQQLRDFGIWTYRVMMFEQDAATFHAPDTYPRQALSTFSTHDMPTFAGWRGGKDIELMRTLGLPAAETADQRAATVRRLGQMLAQRREELCYDAIIGFLFRTPSRLLAVALEDLMGLERQINVPGTWREYPNWRQCLRFEPQEIAPLLERIASHTKSIPMSWTNKEDS